MYLVFSRLATRRCCSHRPLFTSQAPRVWRCLGEECVDFLPWLRRKSGAEISTVLSIGKSAYGRSLFASESIQEGDCILKVPFNVQIVPDNVLPEFSRVDISNNAKLALVILIEQKMGQGSEWAPYMSRLPQIGEMHNTVIFFLIFWSHDELGMIQQSSVYQETIRLQAQIEKEFLEIKPVLDQLPKNVGGVTFTDFMLAYALVGSRAWGSSKGVSLIPFADFLNHDGDSEAIVMSDEDKQFSEVIADRCYVPGEQVLIRYGKFSNATLMLDFGFTFPRNVYDQVQVQVNIPSHDTLHEIKLKLLRGHYRAGIKDVNSFSSSMDSFTIKEVRSTQGKGRGIPQSLRAFARVLCATSHHELSDFVLEAAQNDGRLARCPIENKSREIYSHKMLLSQISQLIEEYIVSIEALGPLCSTCMQSVHAIRMQMARDLLTGELSVLKSAAAWLENYCTVLSTTGYQNS